MEGRVVGSSPTASNGRVLSHRTEDGGPILSALRGTDGTVVWQVAAGPGPSRSKPAVAFDPATDEPFLVVLADGHSVRAFRWDDGEVVWESILEPPLRSQPRAAVVWRPDGSGKSLEDMRIFVTGFADDSDAPPMSVDVVALRASDGAGVWRTRLSAQARDPEPSLAVANGRVFVRLAKSIAALSVVDGALRWQNDGVRNSRLYSTPSGTLLTVDHEGGLVFTIETRAIIARDGRTGETVWELPTSLMPLPESDPEPGVAIGYGVVVFPLNGEIWVFHSFGC
jgi:outer membrane protein assembly factor BamB|tara:strand:- start:1251 stop:2096 length:846 start_codon:yes stop_codon:yes gene_type:complete